MKRPFGTIYQAIDYAITREEDSAIMYMELAKKVANPEISEFFRLLAQEEFEHKKILEFEAIKIGKTIKINDTVDIDPDEVIFEENSLIDIDYREALIMAIKKEDMAFQLYSQLAAQVDNPELKHALLELAEEEIKHKMRFQVEYERISDK